MTTREMQPGDRVSEYVLEERIGRGGFGDVWRARHRAFQDRVVAVKIPMNAERAALLQREGALQDRVRHPHAVEVLGLDAEHDPPYLLLEYVDGESLRRRLEREKRIAPAEAVRILVEVLGALAHAHARGVIHRDLKPENILLTKAGSAKLTDFGLGRMLEEARSRLALSGNLASTAATGEAVGTVAYMAPEQREPGRTVDGRADLYALGIVLFELVTGVRPEGSEAPSDLVAGLDPRLDHVFRRCYARVEKRYARAEEVIADLAALCGEPRALAVAAGPVSTKPAYLAPAGPGAADVVVLGERAVTLRRGVEVQRKDGAYWVVAHGGAGALTTVVPAHAPAGKRPEDLAEAVGEAPLRLAEGMAVRVGPRGAPPEAAWTFHDGPPAATPARPERVYGLVDLGRDMVLSVIAVVLLAGAAPAGIAVAAGSHGPLRFRLAFAAGSVLAVLAGIALGKRVKRNMVGEGEAPPVPVSPGGARVELVALGAPRYAGAEARACARPELAMAPPAGFWIRTCALLLDSAIFAFLFEIQGPRALGLWLAYDWLFTGLFGATAGKYLCGLRVIRSSGHDVGLDVALVRTLSKLVSMLPFYLGFVLAGVTPGKQALHDFFSGTRVVWVPRGKD